MSPQRAPLILTLELDEGSQAWFEGMRRAHFPPERNLIPAHLTLFHQLPGAEEGAVRATVAAIAAEIAPMPLEVTGLFSLGRGVAYRLRSTALEALRGRLAEAFGPWLTRQDQAGFRPHVTVQNKVEPAEAKALLERLQAEFEPFEVAAEGVLVWRYLGGPWELAGRAGFGGG